VNFHRQEVSLSLLRILHYLEANVLIAEYFTRPFPFPELVNCGIIIALWFRSPKLVELSHVIIIKILYYYDIRLFGSITAIIIEVVSILVNIIIRIKEAVDIAIVFKPRPILSGAIIIEIEASVIIIFFIIIYI
jgi:hypothetical protein